MNSLHISMVLNVGSIVFGTGAWSLAYLAVASKKVVRFHLFANCLK